MNDETRFPQVTIRMAANGYILTADTLMAEQGDQWVARTIDEVCTVLHQVLAKPEGAA
jgi:autonomous glycyl radical cofactor GrcA